MADFDIHNGLMSAFDRDIEERRVTLSELAWPRSFFCHSWWQQLSPCRLNWCLQICPGCTFFPLLGSTSWWWVADRFRHWCLCLHHAQLAVAYQAFSTTLPHSALHYGTVYACTVASYLHLQRMRQKDEALFGKFNIISLDADWRLQLKVP